VLSWNSSRTSDDGSWHTVSNILIIPPVEPNVPSV
jgi:hypothetical protein